MSSSLLNDLFSSIIFRAVLLVLSAWWFKWVWGRRHFYVLSYKVPGPTSVPIFGNMMQLGSFTDHRRLVPRLKMMKEKYGGFFRVWFGPTFMFAITQAEDFECVMTSKATYNKGSGYDMIKYTLDFGLLGGSGETWKKHRKIINPAFAILTVRKYQATHDYYAMKMAEKMVESADKGYVDVAIFAQRYFSDTYCDTLFEMKHNFYTGDLDNILWVLVRHALIVHERICKFWLQSDTIFEHSDLYGEYMDLMKRYRSKFHPLIIQKVEDYVKMLKKEGKDETILKEKIDQGDYARNVDEDTESYDGESNKSVVKIMAEAYMAGEVTMQEILDEFNNIFYPGMDTCYTQLSALIMLNGMHKRVQDKLYAELKEFYSYDMDAEVKTEHFTHLPYLDMVFKETMRHFPTGPLQTRTLPEDFYLKSRNLVLPAGSELLLLNVLLHKDEKYWKEPLSFIPERFSPEEMAKFKRPQFAYIPFSYGLRNCIGQIFGNDYVKTGAIHLLRKFEFTADPSWKIETLPTTADISLRSALGYKVMIKKRDRI